MNPFYHEYLYRSESVMRKLRDVPITVCGTGALGANIVESLVRQGCGKLRVIDRDRVEERNLSTQPYYRTDVGAYKAKILANTLYRALGIDMEAKTDTLTEANAHKLLSGTALVIDTFDNSVSRQAVKDYAIRTETPCLHVGLAAEYAEIVWNDIYRVPSAAQDDVCDYPLARNLVMLTVAVACEVIVAFVAANDRRSVTITLGDFAIRPFLL
jgi:molybdopterin/thiamine biosynthesis adenylyltransferase